MITLNQLKVAVEKELDSRNLRSNARYNGLKHALSFIKTYYNGDVSCLEMDKNDFKRLFVEKTGHTGNGASSAINELYNQYRLLKNKEDIGMESVDNNKSDDNEEEPSRLDSLLSNLNSLVASTQRVKSSNSGERDEFYVINLCNEVLGMEASCQHKFDFLLGDSGKPLPVDAYYEKLNLVIEYYEVQHTESVKLFDKRLTVSGVSRGEQRKIYDERRRTELPKHGIKLVIIQYSDFGTSKRIKRNHDRDIQVVRQILKQNGVI